jgi:hypothetical protein
MSIFGYPSIIKSAKPVITIWAEEKGILVKDDYGFGFGNGGNSRRSGYTMLTDGRVIKMGLTCTRGEGNAKVGLTVNGEEQFRYSVLLQSDTSKVVTFPNPLELKAGSVINFVSKIKNDFVKNTVVCLIIELDL